MSNSSRRLSPDEVRRIQQAELTLQQLKKLLGNNYRAILAMQQVQKAFADKNDSFSVRDNRIMMQKINKILKDSVGRFDAILLNAIQKEWELTNPTLWKGLKTVYAKTLKEVQLHNELKAKAEVSVRDVASASRTFYNEKRNGFSISDRVWRLHQNIPIEIDAMVQNAIKEGKSADSLSRELGELLNEPDRIFRKVRNKKTGELEWSEAAKEYKPGRGIYRSAYKNAMRLARTEINAAYRRAEWEAYQNNPRIYGYEIALSNNTENQCEVCKRLAGNYPKWFLWTGWHPQCRCRMLPILMPRNEWEVLLKYRFEGREKDFKYKPITELPPQFIEYMKENQERIAQAGSIPYWYHDNFESIGTL